MSAPQRTDLLALLLAVLAGAGVAVQARLNGGLAARTGPLVAAVVSNTGGLLAIAAFVLADAGRRAAVGRIRNPGGLWWWRLVGLVGATMVLVTAWAVPHLGVALVTVASFGGLTLASVGVDGIGLAPGGRRRAGGQRLAGAGLGLLAVVVATAGGTGRGHPLVVAMVFGVGLLTAVQAAGNAHLRRLTGNASSAVLANFGTGLLGLLVAAAVVAASRGLPARNWPNDPLLYLGGLFGIAFIAASATVVGRLGVLTFTLASITGQLAGALVVDLAAPTGGHVGPGSVAGVALAALAAVVTTRGRPAAHRPLAEPEGAR